MSVRGTAQQNQSGHYVNSIKLAPLRLTNILEPGLEAAYERHFNEQWSAQVNAAAIFRINARSFIPYQNGCSFGAEARRYILDREWFLSAGLAYAHYNAACNGRFLPDHTGNPADSIPYSDQFNIRKDVSFLNLKIGRVLYYKRFTLELTVGASLVYRNAVHTNRDYPDDAYAVTTFMRSFRHGINEGHYWFFRLPGQLRICYSF